MSELLDYKTSLVNHIVKRYENWLLVLTQCFGNVEAVPVC